MPVFWNRRPQAHLGHSLPLTSTNFAFNLWVNYERRIDDGNTSPRRMAIIHRRNPILDHRIGTADRSGHFCHFQRSGGATPIQPLQYLKAVWIGNVVATHGAYHNWALGMCTGVVDGGIFTHNTSVDPRNLSHIKSGYKPTACHCPARCRGGKCGFDRRSFPKQSNLSYR